MIRACCAAVILVLVSSGALAGPTGSLIVTVDGVRDDRGHVRVAVCTRSRFLGEDCAYHALTRSAVGRITVTITGIVPGTYAVAAYQDSTDAGHLRRGLFGIPKDGIGFSRDPGMRFGPPGFDACALTIGSGAQRVSITLHYF